MKMTGYWTVESFGSMCPINWEEICEFVNALIDDGADGQELWESFCEGTLEGCPETIF